MPRCDGKADLVVELSRRRNVAFLLDMESHAGGTGLNAATIQANCLVTIGGVSYAVMESFESAAGAWVEVLDGPVSLRCWRVKPQVDENDIELKLSINRVYIVLPEVFGVNAWVRSVAGAWPPRGIRPWRCRCSPARL